MKVLILILVLCAGQAMAGGLERLTIQNLNFDYNKPYGKGDVEKIGITVSTKANLPTYPIEVNRTEKGLALTTPFVDLTWSDPWDFVHDLEHLNVKNGFTGFGSKVHTANFASAVFTPKDSGAFSLANLILKCNGLSVAHKIEDRLLEDCLSRLDLSIDKLEVPLDFFLSEIVSSLPVQEPLKMEERPADNLKLNVEKGDLALSVYTRVVFYAGLRAWGNVSQTEDHQTIVIRVDQIKFGYLPITTIVMRELKKRIKIPSVTIDGNIIRIKLPHES